MDRIENDASNNSSVVARILRRGNVFTKTLPSDEKRDTLLDPLPGNDGRDTLKRQTDWWEGFMKYAG
jgi:hypothetical protein